MTLSDVFGNFQKLQQDHKLLQEEYTQARNSIEEYQVKVEELTQKQYKEVNEKKQVAETFH